MNIIQETAERYKGKEGKLAVCSRAKDFNCCHPHNKKKKCLVQISKEKNSDGDDIYAISPCWQSSSEDQSVCLYLISHHHIKILETTLDMLEEL